MAITFASDNNAPVAPEILQALRDANDGDAVGYGDDPWTARAVQRIRDVFGGDSDVYFAFNGTGANVVALASLLHPYEAAICPDTAHLNTDECGAFERIVGCKLIALPTRDGKLRVDDLAPHVAHGRGVHHAEPRVVSISQATEFGTLYTLDELRALTGFAHEHGLLVHLDGARIANAATALGVGLRACTRDAGIDVLTFGGTKNGLMFGEAIVYFDAEQHRGSAGFARKQTAQLASKMRYVAAQFEALLQDERWRTYAAHANAMTARLADRVRAIDGVRITRPVEINAIFATLPRAAIERLQQQYFFYCFDEQLPEVRWMTHHATRPEDVDNFANAIARALS